MKTTLFIIWMILTFLLALSIIGWFILASDDYNHKSTWMDIGTNLLKQINNEN